MKKISLSLLLLVFSFASNAQFVAKVQMTDSLEGICDLNEVYALFDGFDGQVSPTCTVSKKEMEQRLNDNLTFLKEHPKFKGKGMVGVFVNCEGQVVEWDIDNKTSSSELDEQILAIFQTFDQWTPGTYNGQVVDTHELFSYDIKKGKLHIN